MIESSVVPRFRALTVHGLRSTETGDPGHPREKLMSIYLRDTTFYDWRTGDLHRGGLVVEPGPRGVLHLTNEPPTAGMAVLDAGGMLACEGLTCGHHHIYSALARGMPAPPRAPRSFAEILELVWWRLDRSLDQEMVRASALAAAIDCLRSGVTRVIDHHASPNAITGALPIIAAAFEEVGLSHLLCYELSDRDGRKAAIEGLEETAAYLASGRPGLVGLHASFTVGDELLNKAVAMALRHGVGLHLHVAEAAVDQERCLADHGRRVVERLADFGVLDQPGNLLVHCLHLSDAERELVRRSGAWVVHNPESNQNNAVGAFSWEGFDPARVLLGTDGMHGDMLRSMRAAFFTAQAGGGIDPAFVWQAFWNSQRYLEQHHPCAARRNDVVLFDYDPPTPLSPDNLLGHAFFGLDARHVRTVIAGGRVVLDEGRLTGLDENVTLVYCREQAQRLWAAMGGGVIGPPHGSTTR
jgi:cytosine/adenosine deaminase-related metal-dependent hydrolase